MIGCAVNPQAAREATFGTVPAGKKKSVLVVGGGVAGMEAARCAASRGHTVTLWEKSGQLGGNLIPAGAHDFKAELNELNAWYQTQLDTLGVAVQRNHPATAQAIQEAHPDAVILAVGATPTVPPVAGMDSPKVVDCVTALTGADLPGQRILVVGGGLVGCETALGYAQAGKTVTIVDHAKMYKDTDELLKKLKLDINSHAKLGTLSIAQMQMVEIAKAVSANCKVLILDEPTSSLTANEVESLFRIMRELKALGVALVYISHKMDEIKVIADEVTIMRDGQYIGKWDVANMTKEQIIAKMVGRELSNLYPPLENHPSDEVMMKVEDFTSIHPRSFRHCSFEIKKGEILGVAGLVGAQRTELMEGIFGLRAHTSGKVWIKGEEVNIKQPRDAIQKSVALLTEDRRATGIMGVLSVADNISIASLDALRKGPIMLDNKKILDLVATNKEKMAIKVPSPKTQIKSLSGGNQQKVLIARWLANNPDVLILDEPTRGIDVGAKYEIYCIIADLAKQGKSIIMISSEMSEIIGMSNRVMVMCDGRITGFIDGKDATQENIMALATQFETAPDAAAANQ